MLYASGYMLALLYELLWMIRRQVHAEIVQRLQLTEW